MSLLLPLQAVPSQRFTATLDGALYDITLKAAGTIMTATILCNGKSLVCGHRLVCGAPLLPYAWMMAPGSGSGGNFALLTDKDAAPWWEDFGSQTLLYVTAAEVAAL